MKFIEQLLDQLNNNKGYAFCIEDKNYTYAELRLAVNNFVKQLRENSNLLKSRRVGVLCTNDINTYASMLACWVSGYAYIPLGLHNPDNRNLNILKDANVDLILTTKDLDVNVYSKYKIINTCSCKIDECNVVNFSQLVEDDDLAYILFTSGSTGKPKGVPISFKNLQSFLDGFAKSPIEIKEGYNCLQMFELTFDVSISSFLPALTFGATVFTVSDKGLRYMNVLKLLNKYDIDIIQIVPSVLRLGKPILQKLSCSSVKFCILTGEATSLDVAEDAVKLMPNATIFNYYGPTEATIYCSYYKYNQNNQIKSYNGMLAIGKSIQGMRFLIVNPETLNLVEDYEKGELLVRGDQITNGYLNNKKKNEEQFVDLSLEGEFFRYYKTGDMSYRDNDKDYFYCGRYDSQIKIQGFRVELNEIEFKAREIFNINNVVIPFVNNNGSTEIVIITEGDLSIQDVVDGLKAVLPNYMIPTRIINLKELPLNTSGKIDRSSLKLIVNEYFAK